MPSSIPKKKKRVSFGGPSSNTIHIVENYKEWLSTPYARSKIWYGAADMERFARDEYFYRCRATENARSPTPSKWPLQSRWQMSSPSRAPILPESPYRSSSQFSSPATPTEKELCQQQTRNLQLAATIQYSSFLARNQPRGSTTRATREALAATRLPSQPNHHYGRRQCQRRHFIQPDVGRVRAVFFSG